jgi:hypothetical protein
MSNVCGGCDLLVAQIDRGARHTGARGRARVEYWSSGRRPEPRLVSK